MATKAEQLRMLAERTGLSRATIKDLMKNGWTYQEALNQPSTFIKDLRFKKVEWNNGAVPPFGYAE